MPEARELYPEVENMTQADLYARYNELKSALGPDPGAIEDDTKLQEMVVILGALRRKSAGPPKAGSGGSRGPKVEPTLDDL